MEVLHVLHRTGNHQAKRGDLPLKPAFTSFHKSLRGCIWEWKGIVSGQVLCHWKMAPSKCFCLCFLQLRYFSPALHSWQSKTFFRSLNEITLQHFNHRSFYAVGTYLERWKTHARNPQNHWIFFVKNLNSELYNLTPRWVLDHPRSIHPLLLAHLLGSCQVAVSLLQWLSGGWSRKSWKKQHWIEQNIVHDS